MPYTVYKLKSIKITTTINRILVLSYRKSKIPGKSPFVGIRKAIRKRKMELKIN